MELRPLVDTLAALPNVVAVALGGSRAMARERPDSDWNLGIYLRGTFDADRVRALDLDGTVVDPGEWGRLLNGGAWLSLDGERVDLLYRDPNLVSHWVREAEAGRFEVDRVAGYVAGYVAGMPTYVLAAELGVCEILHGDLPRPVFPNALQRSAPRGWRWLRHFSLRVAENRTGPADLTMFVGLCSIAVIAEAHARLAARGEWTLNEKGIAERAGLQQAPAALSASLERLRNALAM